MKRPLFILIVGITLFFPPLICPTPASAQVEEVAAAAIASPAVQEAAGQVALFVGEYFLGKALDRAWDPATSKPDEVELKAHLLMLEEAVKQVDKKYGEEVANLRKSINDRTTKEEVRNTVRQVLGEMEERTKKLGTKVSNLEERVKAIETVLGFIPHVVPSPLLRESVTEGVPKAHPKVIEWANLVCRSEANRLAVSRERVKFKDTAPQIQPLVKDEQAILAESAAFHNGLKQEIAEHLEQRSKLLKNFQPAHKDVRAEDDALASLAWLFAVTCTFRENPIIRRPDRVGA